MVAEFPLMLVMVGPDVIRTFFSEAWSMVLVCAATIAAKSRTDNPAMIHVRFIFFSSPGGTRPETNIGTHFCLSAPRACAISGRRSSRIFYLIRWTSNKLRRLPVRNGLSAALPVTATGIQSLRLELQDSRKGVPSETAGDQACSAPISSVMRLIRCSTHQRCSPSTIFSVAQGSQKLAVPT
jgi:hypothetical protein